MGDRFDERSGWPSIDDPQVEALLAGREVSADLAPLAAVVGALKEAAVQPAPPAPSLAQQISAGTFGGAEAAPPPARTGDRRLPGGWWVPAPPGWTVEVTEVQPRLAARTASVGVVIVLLGVGTAGFHGALPEPAQVRFERVVETVTPYEFPERTGGAGDVGSGVQRSVSDGDGDPDGHGESADRTPADAHGAAGPAVERGRAGPVTGGVTGDGAGAGDDNGVGHDGAAGGDGGGGAGDSVGGGVPGGGNVPGNENAPRSNQNAPPGNNGVPGGAGAADGVAGGGGAVGRGDRGPAVRGPVVEVPAPGGHAAPPDVPGRAGPPAGPPDVPGRAAPPAGPPAPGEKPALGNGPPVGEETPPGP